MKAIPNGESDQINGIWNLDIATYDAECAIEAPSADDPTDNAYAVSNIRFEDWYDMTVLMWDAPTTTEKVSYRIYVKNYMIFYVVIDDVMEVRRILYNKRNLPRSI